MLNSIHLESTYFYSTDLVFSSVLSLHFSPQVVDCWHFLFFTMSINLDKKIVSFPFFLFAKYYLYWSGSLEKHSWTSLQGWSSREVPLLILQVGISLLGTLVGCKQNVRDCYFSPLYCLVAKASVNQMDQWVWGNDGWANRQDLGIGHHRWLNWYCWCWFMDCCMEEYYISSWGGEARSWGADIFFLQQHKSKRQKQVTFIYFSGSSSY